MTTETPDETPLAPPEEHPDEPAPVETPDVEPERNDDESATDGEEGDE